jgi:hypothetical protein
MTYLFMLLGVLCMIASQTYIPWRTYWQRMKRPLLSVNGLPPRPAWSAAVWWLGVGLFVLGVWRQWRGL